MIDGRAVQPEVLKCCVLRPGPCVMDGHIAAIREGVGDNRMLEDRLGTLVARKPDERP